MTRTKSTFLALVAVLLSPMAAEVATADIIVIDNGPTLTATWDETFSLIRNMDTGGLVHAIVFDNMFADIYALAPNPTGEIYDLRASVNGGADIVLSPWGGWNYRAGFDSPGNGWEPDSLSILWDPNNLGGAITGDSVRLFGSVTLDKGGFFHVPDFAATTVSFTPYNTPSFSGSQNVSPVPEPGTLALFGIGLFGMGLSRRKKV